MPASSPGRVSKQQMVPAPLPTPDPTFYMETSDIPQFQGRAAYHWHGKDKPGYVAASASAGRVEVESATAGRENTHHVLVAAEALVLSTALGIVGYLIGRIFLNRIHYDREPVGKRRFVGVERVFFE